MQVLEQVFAANQRNQVVVLSSDPKGTETVEWQAKGDPSGADVQIIPESIQRSAQFQRLLQKGIVIEISQEDAYGAVERQNLDFAERTKAASERIQETITHETNRDILSLPCVGPDARNEGKCGIEIPVTQATKDDQPPLCNQHIGLASQYVPTDLDTGRTWTRAGLGPREKAL